MSDKRHLLSGKGFTLMELMICIVVIGLLASFGIPNYQKSVRKGYERNAILNLKTIHGANEIYRARIGQYAPGIALDLAGINSALSIDIIDGNMAYFYERIDDFTYFTDAAWGGANAFTVSIDQTPISDANPCCSAGVCQIVPAC